jgi:quinol monooxygenase YgiN
MYTRVVEINSKTGKGREVARTVSEKVLPILKAQPGFMDEITLVSDDNPDRLLCLSFWNSKENADKYQQEQFSRVSDSISNALEGAPQVRTFNVEMSTFHKIAAGRAA